MARAKTNTKAFKKALMRSNTDTLLGGVMLFQFTAMLLLAFKTETFNTQALVFAVAMPIVTKLTVSVMSKIWPIDRATLIMALMLNSVGIITLQAIARSNVTPRTQAI